jgi:hypothetical protein
LIFHIISHLKTTFSTILIIAASLAAFVDVSRHGFTIKIYSPQKKKRFVRKFEYFLSAQRTVPFLLF